MEYSYYLLRGNGLDERVVMGAINRAKRRFYLRPGYLARHAGDVLRLALDEVGARLARRVARAVRQPRHRRRAAGAPADQRAA